MTALKLRESSARIQQAVISIASMRAGRTAGTHHVWVDTLANQVTLADTARSREEFAGRALLAARRVVGKRGMYKFTNVIDDVLKERTT